jgi:hypothetical protein
MLKALNLQGNVFPFLSISSEAIPHKGSLLFGNTFSWSKIVLKLPREPQDSLKVIFWEH